MRDPRFDGLPFILETPMLSGSLNVDAKPEANGASTSKAKLETKAEEDVLEAYDPSAGNEADVEDEISGQAGLTLGASTWKQEIELLEELQRVPFGQTNEKIDKLSSDIRAIVAEYQRRQEEQQKAAKEAKDALKEAKKAAEKAEKGEQPEKETKPRAPRKRTSKKKEVETKVEEVEREPSEEMEIDSSEVDQLASDYEEPPPKL